VGIIIRPAAKEDEFKKLRGNEPEIVVDKKKDVWGVRGGTEAKVGRKKRFE
jgi:hypothetical protein